nr:metalloregulator ArsR/SmtB family transcription factor [Frankia sp. CgIM4]
MDEFSRIFAALADATRRNMVERLVKNDATVGELAEPYEISLQAVSRHLKVLQEAGLIRRPGGCHRSPVRLEEDALGPAARWIQEFYSSRLRSRVSQFS